MGASAKIRLIAHPYDNVHGGSLGDILISQLAGGRWTRFAVAVAFVRQSGNWDEFLDALEAFARTGNELELTFGANTTSAEPGSDFEAIRQLLRRLDYPTVAVYLYHEPSRLFHPKLYLFDNVENNAALLITGSSNWTRGGFYNNVEASLIVELDLTDENDRIVFDSARRFFSDYWQEPGAVQ